MNIGTLLGHFGDYMTYSTPMDNTTSNIDPAVYASFMAMVFISLFVILIGTYVVTSFLLGRIFKKAGIESWKAWVPFYSHWVLLEMGDQQGFWAVLAIVPFVNIASLVFLYIAMHNVSLKFGKQSVFVLWAIFIPLVWYIWLAFDKSTWQGSVPVTASPVATQPETNENDQPKPPVIQ